MRWGDVIGHLELAVQSYGGEITLPAPAHPISPLSPPAAPRQASPEPIPAPIPAPASDPATNPEADPAANPDTSPATSLEDLRAQVLPCRSCKLSEKRTQVVFGEGDAHARVMFVGEAPGFHEDKQGRPFVGKAGQLLDRIVENAMGMRRSEVYIANVNKCRPPENRDPQPDEVAACLPHLRAQIDLIQPEVIVALGRVAAHNLLSTTISMSRLRGQELRYQGIPVVATWHPAYLLRNESAKADTWEDIKRVNRLLGHPERPDPPGRGS